MAHPVNRPAPLRVNRVHREVCRPAWVRLLLCQLLDLGIGKRFRISMFLLLRNGSDRANFIHSLGGENGIRVET